MGLITGAASTSVVKHLFMMREDANRIDEKGALTFRN